MTGEFGEEVGYDEEALRPIECVTCGLVNSATNDLCKECGNALNEQGEQLTKEETTQPLEKKISRIAEEKRPRPTRTNGNRWTK